jgi:alpha-amylase
VNYFQNGFTSLINFDFKGDANKSYEELFSNHDKILHQDLTGKTVMNQLEKNIM